MRSRLLAAEQLALGMTPVVQMRLARRCEVSSLGGPIDALGWLFVVELLSWQARDVRRRLSTTLSDELSIAGSYFALHDGVHHQRWRELSRTLDRWASDASALQALRAAAQTALDSLERWMIPVELP
jgi:heme oxygenase